MDEGRFEFVKRPCNLSAIVRDVGAQVGTGAVGRVSPLWVYRV